MKQIKVLVIAPGVLPIPDVKGGAIENIMTSFCEVCNAYGDIKLEIVSCASRLALKNSYKYSNVVFHYIGHNSIFLLLMRFTYRLYRAINNNVQPYLLSKILHEIDLSSYDYIVVNNAVHYLIPISKKIKSSKGSKTALISYIHNSIYLDQTLSHYVDKFFFVSDYVKSTQNDKIKQKGCVVYNQINADKFLAGIQEQRIGCHTVNKNDEFIMVFCGRIVRQKGVIELINSIKRIKTKFGINVSLTIIGSYEGFIPTLYYLKCRLFTIFTSNELIKFYGKVPNAKVGQIYRNCDALILPSIEPEAAGLVILEAEATGLPTIVTSIGGAIEYSSYPQLIFDPLVSESTFDRNLLVRIRKIQDYETPVKSKASSNCLNIFDIIRSDYEEKCITSNG